MRLFFSSIVFTIFLISTMGCSRYITRDLAIGHIDIFISENKPDYLIVMVYGDPDGCESVNETQYWVEGNTINIRITVTEEIAYGTHCDLAADNFRIPVYIGQWDAIGAYDTYKVNVNGVTEVFRIENDRISIIRELDVRSIDIDISESRPAQVRVQVNGYFWKECVEFIETHHKRAGRNTINIKIEAKIPNDVNCSIRTWDELTEYQEVVDIGTFTAGGYKVVVNGHEQIFRIN